MARVHATAVVEAEATLAEDVEVGPLCHVSSGAVLERGVRLHAGAQVGERSVLGERCCLWQRAVVGAGVKLGAGCQIGAAALVLGPTRLGSGCRVHSHAVVGDSPQDRTFAGEDTELVVGDEVILREHVTVHRGTSKGGGVTRIGSRCLLMVGVHVAHDCLVGDDVQLANLATLGGHVRLGDHVVCAGHVAIAPFVRIGRGAYLAGGAMVERDVPPYAIAAGDRARVRAPNRIGLERIGVPEPSRRALIEAYRVIYASGLPLLRGLERAREAYGADAYVAEFLTFVEPAGD